MLPHILNEDERLRVAADSPVDVYVPAADDTRYIVSRSDYWPHRALGFEASPDRLAHERTKQRSRKYLVYHTQTDPWERTAPRGDVYELADRFGADFVYPGLAAEAEHPTEIHHEYVYDLDGVVSTEASRARPRLITPTATTRNHMSRLGRALEPDVDSEMPLPVTKHSAPFVGLGPYSTSDHAAIAADLESLYDVFPLDTQVALIGVKPTLDLVRYLRTHPVAVDMLVLWPGAVNALADEIDDPTPTDALTARGRRELRETVEPGVALAAELSLLLSPLVDETELDTLADDLLMPPSAQGYTFADEEAALAEHNTIGHKTVCGPDWHEAEGIPLDE